MPSNPLNPSAAESITRAFADGGFINSNNGYLAGLRVGPMSDRISSRATIVHITVRLNADQEETDDTNRDIVARWSRGEASRSEIEILRRREFGCPCGSCLRSAYDRVYADVGDRPQGYGEACRCIHCMAWRNGMAEGIYQVIQGVHPRGSYSIRMSEVAMSRDQWVADRSQEIAIFERLRARRGHPLPKLAMPADWQPNKWEA